MADWWVDAGATGTNDGTSPTNAWSNPANISYAGTSVTPVWVRRTTDYNVGVAITVSGGAGTLAAPVQIIGWPRASFSVTATFTQGSTSVTGVTSPAVSWRRYGARFIRCDSDGQWYLITRSPDSGTTLTIDRPYASTTATSAAATVQEDEDYAARPAAGTSAGWDADDQDLPRYYGDPSTYMMTFGAYNNIIKNLYLQKTGTTAATMITFPNYGLQTYFGVVGCVINTEGYNYSASILSSGSSHVFLDRFVITGSNYNNKYGLYNGCNWRLSNGAIYSCYYGIYTPSYDAVIDLDNVNLGVEGACLIDARFRAGIVCGRNVKSGNSTPGYRLEGSIISGCGNKTAINIENYQKDRDQILRTPTGTRVYSLAVDSSTTDPRKRTDGGDIVLKVDLGSGETIKPTCTYIKDSVFDQRIYQVASTTKAYRVYLQTTNAIASGLVTLEATYLSVATSSTQYVEINTTGTGAISTRSGVTDWSQYVEVTGITPAATGAVRLRLYVRKYDSGDFLYVDPLIVVS